MRSTKHFYIRWPLTVENDRDTFTRYSRHVSLRFRQLLYLSRASRYSLYMVTIHSQPPMRGRHREISLSARFYRAMFDANVSAEHFNALRLPAWCFHIIFGPIIDHASRRHEAPRCHWPLGDTLIEIEKSVNFSLDDMWEAWYWLYIGHAMPDRNEFTTHSRRRLPARLPRASANENYYSSLYNARVKILSIILMIWERHWWRWGQRWLFSPQNEKYMMSDERATPTHMTPHTRNAIYTQPRLLPRVFLRYDYYTPPHYITRQRWRWYRTRAVTREKLSKMRQQTLS